MAIEALAGFPVAHAHGHDALLSNVSSLQHEKSDNKSEIFIDCEEVLRTQQ